MNHSLHVSKFLKNHSALPTNRCLNTTVINTPLGQMIAIADESMLYLLEFTDRPDLEQEIKQLTHTMHATVASGDTEPLSTIKSELQNYFNGTLTVFTTPIALLGTPFQKKVWHHLQQIPFGDTRSYSAMAITIDQPSAFRAVARANSMNKLALIVPCHRVINANGSLSGYAGGITRKKWLIEHENKYKTILKRQI